MKNMYVSDSVLKGRKEATVIAITVCFLISFGMENRVGYETTWKDSSLSLSLQIGSSIEIRGEYKIVQESTGTKIEPRRDLQRGQGQYIIVVSI